MGGSPPPPRTQSGLAGFERKPIGDDDFAAEEPTGEFGVDPAEAGGAPAPEPLAKTPEYSARSLAATPRQQPAPEKSEQDAPEQADIKARRKRTTLPGVTAPPAAASYPRVEDMIQAVQAEQAMARKPVPAKRRTRAIWLVIVALLAIIALLIWRLAA